MAAETSLQEPLDRLPGHVNTVLIQIGRIFQHSVRSDVKTYSQARSRGHESIAKASRQFHEALDEVEMELLKAKLVLERDLTSLRAKRAERENALRAERLRASGKVASEINTVTVTKDKNFDVPVKLEANSDLSQTKEALKKGELTAINSNMVKSELADVTNGSKEDTLTGELNHAATAKAQTPQELRDLGVSEDIFGGSLGSTGFPHISADADFDSMFDDSGASGANTLNFDFDFPDSNGATEGQQTASAFGPVSSTAEVGNLDATSSEDINSLLPGLESYVNADSDGGVGDFAMIDISSGGDNAPVLGQQHNTASTTQASATDDPSIMGLDTSFDYMIGSDNMNGVGTDNFDFDAWLE